MILMVEPMAAACREWMIFVQCGALLAFHHRALLVLRSLAVEVRAQRQVSLEEALALRSSAAGEARRSISRAC
jgi:hypothetical protein